MSNLAIIQWAFALLVSLGCALTLKGRAPVLSFAPLLVGLVLLAFQRDEAGWWRLLSASLLFLYLVKCAVLLKSPTHPRGLGLGAFLTVWPGMDPATLTKMAAPDGKVGALFVRGLVTALLGLALAFLLAVFYPETPVEVVSWLGIAALLLTVHLGFGGVLSAMMRLVGWPVKPLFDRPLASKSLRDFWTKRWNRPFVEMDRILFMEPLRRMFGVKGAVFGVFVVSGLLHEMAISYPAGAGWGGPLAYFVLQGVAVLIEARFKIMSRIWTWVVILAPLPLLFHAPFRHAFIVPLFEWLYSVAVSRPIEGWLDLLLWVLGIAHFLVLIASFQVPFRLKWREELPALSSFNRKLVWTLGGFTTMTIAAFGTFTLVLHRQLLAGDTAALAIAVYIVCFWCVRLLVDTFYYRHSDWPEGPQFVIGHALLNSLFLFLVLGYGSVLMWHLTR